MTKRKTTTPARRRPAGTEPRRTPSQDRGQRRVEEILDAAEAVIVEVGVEAATTNGIAERAGAGVGSLYHFFPNKEAIVAALAERYRQDLLQLAKVMLEPEMAVIPIPEMAARIVFPIAEYLRRRPAYLDVYHAGSDRRTGAACHPELHEQVYGIVERLMRARSPHRDKESVRISSMAAVELVHRLLEFAQGLPAKAREAMIQETVRILIVHAETVSSGRDPLLAR